jgi:transposase-like protein
MAQRKDSKNLTELLWECLGAADPMFHMLEWLCDQLMETEISSQISAEKHEQNRKRTTSRSGYCPRRLETRMSTIIYLKVPKVRNGGYIPFFSSPRGNAVRQRSSKSFRRPMSKAFRLGRLRSWRAIIESRTSSTAR